MVASLTISEDRRSALITWLRSLRGQEGSVTLHRKKRGVLQLIHANRGSITASVEVRIEESGTLSSVSLNAAYLATALEIAPTLWLIDEMSPVVARRPDGAFCVVMPMRPTGIATDSEKPGKRPTGQAAA
jgi:hypothetical protein